MVVDVPPTRPPSPTQTEAAASNALLSNAVHLVNKMKPIDAEAESSPSRIGWRQS